MAKRLDTIRRRDPAAPPPVTGGATGSCSVCGGPVVVEDLDRDERFPQRLRCAVCDAEYGTTRPPGRNY